MSNGELREKLALALEDMKAKAIEMGIEGVATASVLNSGDTVDWIGEMKVVGSYCNWKDGYNLVAVAWSKCGEVIATHGNTATALHEVERTLQKQGIETDWMHVGQLQIHGCIACNKCWTTGVCAFGDIVNDISVKMREADGLLIGSPVYFASPNGTLLSLLDRLFYSNLHTDWTMKVGASVSIARRGGATATMDVLNKYFLKTNMPVVPSQYWSIAHGTAPGEVVRDKEGMQTMRQLGLNMAFMMKSIRLGLQQFGSPKILEELTETHYIR